MLCVQLISLLVAIGLRTNALRVVVGDKKCIDLGASKTELTPLAVPVKLNPNVLSFSLIDFLL